MNYQQIISIYARAQSITQMAKSLRRSGLSCNEGWRLANPLSFHMVNSAAILCRLNRVEDRNVESIEGVKIRLASLRHFTRQIEGSLSVSIKQVESGLKLNTEINVDGIKQMVRDQVAMRLRTKPMSIPQIIKMRTEMEALKLEEAAENARINRAIVDEVFFLCNSDGFDIDGQEVLDAKLVDWDQYGYILESLVERLEQPLLLVRQHCTAIAEASCISETINKANALLAETEKLLTEAGFDLDKLDAKLKSYDKLMAEADAELVKTEMSVEEALAAADESMPDIQPPSLDDAAPASPKRNRVPAAVAQRQAEETAVKVEAKAHDKAVAAALNKARAAKAAKAKAKAEAA